MLYPYQRRLLANMLAATGGIRSVSLYDGDDEDGTAGLEIRVSKLNHSVFDPAWVEQFLDQDVFWQVSGGRYVRIENMAASHAFNTLWFLLDNSSKILLASQIGAGIVPDPTFPGAEEWIVTTKLWGALLARVKAGVGPATPPWAARRIR